MSRGQLSLESHNPQTTKITITPSSTSLTPPFVFLPLPISLPIAPSKRKRTSVRRKRRRMDNALPSPSPTPAPRDPWAEYRSVLTRGGIVMLSPADMSPANPWSYAHRREVEAMDALWARPFAVGSMVERWGSGVERVSRQQGIGQRLALRGCSTNMEEHSSFESSSIEIESHQATESSPIAVQTDPSPESILLGSPPPDPPDPDPQTPDEGPFWFGPPLVARYSRGAPYTLQACRARQALSDLLRAPFGNRHFRLEEDTAVSARVLAALDLNLPPAVTLAAGVPWSHVLDQWPNHADGLTAIATTQHATILGLLRLGRSPPGSPNDMEESESDTALPFLFVRDADTSSLAGAKTALLVSMRAALAILARLYTAGGAPPPPDSAGQAFGLLQNGEAWELYMMHRSPASPGPYSVTRLWHGRMDVAVDVVTFQTLCGNILSSVDERVAFTVECLGGIHRSTRRIPGIVINDTGSATPGGASAIASAGASFLASKADFAADNLGAYNTIREAIAAASPRPGGLEALQAVLAQGPIAGERNFAITRQALAALNLPLAPTNVTVALGLPRSEREGGSKMALPFFFASHGGLVGLFTAMRAGLGALGGLMDAAQLARTRAWLRGRSVPAPPRGGMAAYGLVLGQQAELWVMTRGPYFLARAWLGRLGTAEFAGVLANILGARERANFVAQCLQTIKEGREALASADEQPFDTWWRGNGGDTPARTFERRLADVGFADGGARVVAWVRAQDPQAYLAPDQESDE
ncbi:hypothetical protein CspHIS471_0402550 [Cutaneotrichosporon sp. HIS471]|nr:hypothetical protein CspHIS471_0402550 [Cutaneotrichosporon sp. HIS471]